MKNRTGRRPLVLTLLLTVAFFACSPALRSVPAPRELQVDGRALEWGGAELVELGALALGVQHDESCLYVYLSTGNPWFLRALAETGITVWVKPDNTEEHLTGMRFNPSPELLRAGDETRTRAMDIERVGYVDELATSVAFEGGVSGLWVAELQFTLPPSSTDTIELAVELVVLPKSARPSRPAAGGQRMPRGMGGGRTGGMGGRMGGNARQPPSATPQGQDKKRATPEPKRVWFELERVPRGKT